jgi:hypothetical protein
MDEENITAPYWPPVPQYNGVGSIPSWSKIINAPKGLTVYVSVAPIKALNRSLPAGVYIADRNPTYLEFTSWQHVGIDRLELRCVYVEHLRNHAARSRTP